MAIICLEETEDAQVTAEAVEGGQRCVRIAGDLGDAEFCRSAVGGR